jgi:hypothetical protein
MESAAQILTSTVFARIVTGRCRAIQGLSTNLSTDFCGYRYLNYIWSIPEPARCSFGALRNLPRSDGFRKVRRAGTQKR